MERTQVCSWCISYIYHIISLSRSLLVVCFVVLTSYYSFRFQDVVPWSKSSTLGAIKNQAET